MSSNWLLPAQVGSHHEYDEPAARASTATVRVPGHDDRRRDGRRWIRRRERQRPVGDEDVQAHATPSSGRYLLGQSRPQGGLRLEPRNRPGLGPTRAAVAEGGQLVQIGNPLDSDPLQRPLYTHIFFASQDSTVDNPISAP